MDSTPEVPLLVNVEGSRLYNARIHSALEGQGISRSSVSFGQEGQAVLDLYLISWPKLEVQTPDAALINLRASFSFQLRPESVVIARAPLSSLFEDRAHLHRVWEIFEGLKEKNPDALIFSDLDEALRAVASFVSVHLP